MDATNGTQLKDLLEQIGKDKATAIELVEELSEGGKVGAKRLVIEQRSVQPPQPLDPIRAESPARAHDFHAAGAFVDYLQRYGSKRTVVLIDLTACVVYAVLDETADRGREVLMLKPQIHPRWKPWHALLGRNLEMPDLLDHLRNNRRSMVDGRDVILALSQVKASTEVTLYRGSGHKALNGLLVKTSINGVKGEQIVEIPEVLHVKAPIFVDSEPIQIELDLIVEGSQDGTSVRARFSSADILEAEIEGMERIAEHVGDLRDPDSIGCAVGYGVPKNTAWGYLRTT